MSDRHESTELLNVVGKILLRCFLLGYLLLLVWFACFLWAPGLVYKVSQPFDLTSHEINVINYCGLVFVKSCVLIFFLLPWISIRLVLRNRAR
jgi:hypothetical protein